MDGLVGGLSGDALGGFVAMVALVVRGVEWWTVAMLGGIGIIAALTFRWRWARRAARP